jgi:hypothetical protein
MVEAVKKKFQAIAVQCLKVCFFICLVFFHQVSLLCADPFIAAYIL